MRRIFVLLILCVFSGFAYAQHIPFTVETGDKISKVTYDGKMEGGTLKYVFDHGSLKYYMSFDGKFETIEWKISDPANGTDFKAVKKGDTIVLKGKFNGKDIDRTDNLDGQPWYQQMGISAGHVLNGGTVKFYCLRPTDLNGFFMTATEMGEVTYKGKKVHRVKAAPAGIAAKFWSCDYYYDCKELTYAGYQAVEGGPGTPVSYWYIAE